MNFDDYPMESVVIPPEMFDPFGLSKLPGEPK